MAKIGRILVLGGTGMLGHKLWERLPTRLPEHLGDVWITVRGGPEGYSRDPRFQGPRVAHGVDVENPASLDEALERIRPEVVVNAVAVTKRHEGAKDDPAAIARAIRINSELPHRLAAWARPRRARVIQFSTDCVFSGARGEYTEKDVPDADDLYGRSKLLGELGATEGRCLTIRSSLVGREAFHQTELLEWFLKQAGKTVRGFRGATFSGLATWVMADLVAELIEKHAELAGVYHVASEPITKFDLLGLFRDAFDVPVTIEPDDSVSCHRDLDGRKFREATGWVAPGWPEMVRGIANGN